jgi:hypothetical protein
MNLIKEIENSETTIQVMIDLLGAQKSTLAKAKAVLQNDKQLSSRAKARQENKDLIMADIIKFDGRSGKPSIAKKKRL